MNLSLTAALFGLALASAGCGADPEIEATSAPTDDSGEVQLPLGDYVTVGVTLPSNESLAGTIVVVLEDVSVQDAAAIELGRVELTVDEFRDQGSMAEVPLAQTDTDLSMVSAVVHIDVDANGTFSSGDWLSMEHVPVNTEMLVTVNVNQI